MSIIYTDMSQVPIDASTVMNTYSTTGNITWTAPIFQPSQFTWPPAGPTGSQGIPGPQGLPGMSQEEYADYLIESLLAMKDKLTPEQLVQLRDLIPDGEATIDLDI